MRLYRTMRKTIRWKWFVFSYIAITNAIIWRTYVVYDPELFLLLALGIGAYHFFFISLAMAVFSNSIHNKKTKDVDTFGYWPIIWLFFSYTTPDVTAEWDSAKGRVMRTWCFNNCEGKWKHCKHGYFAFREKTDLLAFKLRWME